MIETVIFVLLAILAIVPAVLMVSVRNVFHAGLWLVVSLLGVAGLYALLAADFLFAVQLLVYAGGIMVILLFVVLLSGRPDDWSTPQTNGKALAAALFSAFLVVVIEMTFTAWPVDPRPTPPLPTTKALGALLLTDLALPFEAISLVLVAALVGAVYFSSAGTRDRS